MPESNTTDKLFSPEIVETIVKGMKSWDVPGCAVVVVPMKPGMGPPGVRCFGERQKGEKVTPNTAFPLASASKHILSLSLHLALDRLGLSWKTKVVDILPDFRLDDEKDGKEVMVEDLLCHRTGMPGWDGMYAPGLSERFVDKLKSLPIAQPTRSDQPSPFSYNSVLFDLAAHLIPRLTNKSIEDFVQEEFFDPMGLKASYRSVKMGERAAGHWVRVSKEGVDKGREVGYAVEDCGEAWGAGRIWMDSQDLIRWMACAPHMAGFDDIATPRNTDPDDGLFFPDEHQGYGLGLRVYRHRGVKVVCHNGSIPGFATQISWLPDLDVGFAVLSNSDLGGTYLRALIACKLVEAAEGLEKKEWYKIIHKRYTLDTSHQSWMDPIIGVVAPSADIVGVWSHPAFGTWTINPDDIVSTRPALGSLPYLPGLYCKVLRRLFVPVGKGEYAGSVECEVAGEVFFGMPCEVNISQERMEVRGLSGASDKVDNACPLIFTKKD